MAGDSESVNGDISERPSKRRRLSKTHDVSTSSSPPRKACGPPNENEKGAEIDALHISLQEPSPATNDNEDISVSEPEIQDLGAPGLPAQLDQLRMTRSQVSTMRPSLLPLHLAESSFQSSGSNDTIFSAPELSQTSSQTDDTITYSASTPIPYTVELIMQEKVESEGPFSSSPLSSPPPILFDPYENPTTEESTEGSSECSDDSDSEEIQSSSELLASQTSHSRLRNMKGRDLFDSNIWSDPLKTSVFYRFATSLRQKVKDVQPTATHHFIARLRDAGKLARVYTQNIDEIEKKIGLSTDLKVGAGNKRRKSAKQQQLPEQDKDNKDDPEQVQGDGDAGGKEIAQASQPAEDGDRTKSRATVVPDRGVECVFLHGSLHALRCFVCARLSDWDEDGRELCTMSGEQPECPHCAGATAARQEKGKRALGVGKLRPDIVLYGEEHPQSDLISPIVQHDLSASPDLLLVLGTSLRVHGLKVMVREFAKAVHNKGGKVVFVNFTKPSESTWGDVIDYWIEWDCDAWVEDLKERKPTLWMSPEAILEHEKQKREALAEKKRESISNKKRESIAEKKRDSAGNKRRATIQVLEPDHESKIVTESKKPKLEPKVVTEPKKPAKNPQSWRNDYYCGAYCMNQIADAFAMLRGDKCDLFGYQQRAQQPSPRPTAPGKVTKEKKPRKSAPAVLTTALGLDFKAKVARKSAAKPSLLVDTGSRDRFKKAATGLFNARRSQTPQWEADLRGSSGAAGNDTCRSLLDDLQLRNPAGLAQPTRNDAFSISNQVGEQYTPAMSPAAQNPEPPASISAAIKSNPRARKPTSKIRDGMPLTPAANLRSHPSPAVPPLPAQDQENVLPPIRIGRQDLTAPPLATMEPVLNPSPPHSPLDQTPLASLSPNQRKFGLRHLQHPMMLSAPLIKLPFALRKEPTPSPSDQLREEAAIALSGMRTWR